MHDTHFCFVVNSNCLYCPVGFKSGIHLGRCRRVIDILVRHKIEEFHLFAEASYHET